MQRIRIMEDCRFVAQGMGEGGGELVKDSRPVQHN